MVNTTAEYSRSRQEASNAILNQYAAAGRDVKAREPVSRQRRDDLEHDDAKWLREYFPDVFYNQFTGYQVGFIEDCGDAFKYGVKKCKAAPRGGGKSSILKYLALKYWLYRKTAFSLLLAATYPKSVKTVQAIKIKLRSPTNKLLHADFPFECDLSKYIAPATKPAEFGYVRRASGAGRVEAGLPDFPDDSRV